MDPDYWWEVDSPDASETDADRRAHWGDYLARRQGTIGLGFSGTGSDGDFAWSTIAQKVGDLQIVRFESDPVHYRRTARNAKDDGEDGYRLMLPLRGEFKLRQGDSAEIFTRGSLALIRWDVCVVMQQNERLQAIIMTVPAHLIDLDRARQAPLALDVSRPLTSAAVPSRARRHECDCPRRGVHHNTLVQRRLPPPVRSDPG